jgi:hypothetical protein
VSDDVAEEVRAYLGAGKRLEALLTLDAMATEIAPLDRVHESVSNRT